MATTQRYVLLEKYVCLFAHYSMRQAIIGILQFRCLEAVLAGLLYKYAHLLLFIFSVIGCFFLAIGNIVYLSSEYLQYLIKCSISPQRYRSLFGLLSSQLENLQPLLGNPLSPGPCVFPFKSVFESFGAFTSFPLIFLPSSHSDLLLFF